MNERFQFQVRIHCIRYEGEGVLSLEMVSLEDSALPPFTAGAHIDLHLRNGLTRRYSLINDPRERHRYLVGIHRNAKSRGGSRFLHEEVRAGEILTIEAPRNHFELAEEARHSTLIAGGIGVTPLLCMIERLVSLGKPWTLHYCARTRKHAAFLSRLQQLAELGRGTLLLNFDQEPNGRMLDIQSVVDAAPPGTHFYCCGPTPMLKSFEAATANLPLKFVHMEYFTAIEQPASAGGFVVQLARQDRSFTIQPGQSILEVLLNANVDVPYSCMEGVCGACETKVLEGIPDHRDVVLNEEERDSSSVMLICCSGAKSERLLLDI